MSILQILSQISITRSLDLLIRLPARCLPFYLTNMLCKSNQFKSNSRWFKSRARLTRLISHYESLQISAMPDRPWSSQAVWGMLKFVEIYCYIIAILFLFNYFYSSLWSSVCQNASGLFLFCSARRSQSDILEMPKLFPHQRCRKHQTALFKLRPWEPNLKSQGHWTQAVSDEVPGTLVPFCIECKSHRTYPGSEMFNANTCKLC